MNLFYFLKEFVIVSIILAFHGSVVLALTLAFHSCIFNEVKTVLDL